MHFDLDESLIPFDQALHGLVPLDTIAALEREWKATKVDEWCAVSALRHAATGLRRATGRPDAAPIEFVLTDAAQKAPGDARVRRALAAYEQAATVYEGVRSHLADLRNRATIPAT
ncbi:hypothetical protein D0T12_18420 [Actinomadura spongiicola]|uniref:Uncharacterized protein n=1 Tax=Actinomadura spongiicola TaxID=2303421 RepID=A0A372GFH4_9ACTN|nr:hypothetical protein [Actinomadura spongiicola]RFS84134.1 hypothetical protein D0T12_18420 [Actinomadura spongiicola]